MAERAKRGITRWGAAALHFGVTVLIAAAVFAAIYFVWYPGALFGAAGGRDLFLLIAGVALVLGPVITLIIYVPGKRGLAFDLVVLAAVQAAALGYGVWVLYESRPVWIVFVKDRFELVRANQIVESERAKAKPPYDELSVTGPRVIGARMPSDPDEQLRIGLTGAAGQDLQTYPQYFVAYDEVRESAAAKGEPMRRLVELNPGAQGEIARVRAKAARPDERLRFLPLRAGKRDLTVVVDAQGGEWIDAAALRPWEYQ